MPIPASSTLKAAIASSVRQPVLQITLNLGGTDYTFTSGAGVDMITGYSLQRTPQEQVIRASQISGTIAAQCNFTLQGWQTTVAGGFLSSADLSIYKAGFNALRDNGYGIDAKVTVKQGFVTTVGPEYVQVFVGYVDKIDVSDQGAISFLCLDFSKKMQVTGTIPAIANMMEPEAIVEELLRQCGLRRTPPPVGNVLIDMSADLVNISDWSTIGGSYYFPDTSDIGPNGFNSYIGFDWKYGNGSWHPSTPVDPIRPGMVFVTEGRVATVLDNFPTQRNFLNIGPGLYPLLIETDGTVWIVGPIVAVNTGLTIPRDNLHNSRYFYSEMVVTSTGFDWYLKVDGADASGTAVDDWTDWYTPALMYVKSGLWEGVQVRVENTATYVRNTRENWTPDYGVDWRGTPVHVSYTQTKTGKVIDLVNELANDLGARWRWTEDGTLLWENADAIQAARFETPSSAVDDTKALMASGFGYDGASRIKDVTIDYRNYSTRNDTGQNGAAYAWTSEGSDVITVGANRREKVKVSTALPIIGQIVIIHLTCVFDYQVGDPAAVPMSSVALVDGFVSIIDSSTIELTLYNNTNKPIAFWDPTGAPAIAIRGLVLLGGDPRTATVTGSAGALESFTVAESTWRQDQFAATAHAEAIAADAALPAIVFSQQQVVSDPTRTVGDVINLQAATLMDAPIPCIIIGKDSDMDEDTLTVVPCYPPTGWVLGVTGRSELATTAPASTTILVA